jgi:hypothetical protein
MFEQETTKRIKVKFAMPNDEVFEIQAALYYSPDTNARIVDLMKELDRAGNEYLQRLRGDS